MRYTLISFDDNNFLKARLTINDMVLIERYTQRNPLEIFNGTVPPKGDLIYILFIALKETGMYETLDDFYDFIDDRRMRVPELTEIVLQLLIDMGFVNGKDESMEDSGLSNSTSSNRKPLKQQSFEETMKGLLDSYKHIGSADKFWSSNLEEVTHEFDMFRLSSKHLAENNYLLALMITSDIGVVLSGKKSQKMQPIEKFFPHLYTEEELAENEVDQRTKESFSNLMSFANRFQAAKRLKEDGNFVKESDEEV